VGRLGQGVHSRIAYASPPGLNLVCLTTLSIAHGAVHLYEVGTAVGIGSSRESAGTAVSVKCQLLKSMTARLPSKSLGHSEGIEGFT